MTKTLYKTLAGSTMYLAAMSSSAMAQVSAEEVWANWTSYAESLGQTMTVGTQNRRGDTLSLENIQFGMEMPEGKAGGVVDLIELRERGDGTVEITMSPEMIMSIALDPEQGESVNMTLTVAQAGLAMVASGTPEVLSYDYLASQLSISIDDLVADGQKTEGDIKFSISDIDGAYTVTEGEMRQVTSEMSAMQANLAMDITDPTDQTRIQMSGSYDDFKTSSDMMVAKNLSVDDPAWFFNGGLNGSGTLTTGATKYNMSVLGDNGPMTVDATAADSQITFSIEDGSLAYGGETNDLNYSLIGAMIPFPSVNMAMAQAAFELKMPTTKTNEPRDFGLLTRFSELTISDAIWNMFDPGGQLPRDPATLVIDFAGKMNFLVDFMSAKETGEMAEDGKMPAEIHELSINEVRLKLAGADIQGSGNFTFDNSDLQTFGGMPAPTGTVDISIEGVNGLMETLVGMGLLPQDQAMGARMMLGMFAQPAAGPDSLTSKIEVRGNGSVFANGQQIK